MGGLSTGEEYEGAMQDVRIYTNSLSERYIVTHLGNMSVVRMTATVSLKIINNLSPWLLLWLVINYQCVKIETDTVNGTNTQQQRNKDKFGDGCLVVVVRQCQVAVAQW